MVNEKTYNVDFEKMFIFFRHNTSQVQCNEALTFGSFPGKVIYNAYLSHLQPGLHSEDSGTCFAAKWSANQNILPQKETILT